MTNELRRTVRILLVDDHAVVRAGLRMLLESSPDYIVVGEAGVRHEALSLATALQPDLVLLDLDLGGRMAADLIPELRAVVPEARVLVLTGVADSQVHRDCVRLGARGVVSKEKAADFLLKAVEKVHHGELWLDRTTAAGLITALAGNEPRSDPDRAKLDLLTAREREVAALIAQGLKNKEIAGRLFISETTVRHHLTSIYAKLAVPDRLSLLLFAVKHGLAAPTNR
jgi:DNA-binding NarL/FixJ family response regulator